MILDALEAMDRYSAIHPGFTAAFEYLRSIDADGFSSGKREIIGDKLFATASINNGVGVSAARLEAHRKYIDIQYSVGGIDNIGWRHLSRCSGKDGVYDTERDVIFYSDIPETWFGLVPGTCAIFFPEDAHAPLAVNGNLHKIVLKIAVDW